MSPILHARPRLRTLRSRSSRRLLEILEKERGQVDAMRIVSCCKAGRDGFWLDRFLHSNGVDNRIVDSASVEVRRRARRVKTDRLDAQKLLTMLQRLDRLALIEAGSVWLDRRSRRTERTS